jgi:hypothetical protein
MLIPRAHLFGNPTRAAARISPDGTMLSWLAPVDGVLNVFVAPTDAPGSDAGPRTRGAHLWLDLRRRFGVPPGRRWG